MYYDNESYILYRQHGSNTSGAMINKNNLFRYRLQQLFKPRGEIYYQASNFLTVFGNNDLSSNNQDIDLPKISIENMKLIKDLLKSRQKFLYRIKLTLTSKLYRQKVLDNIILKFIILIGKL